MSVGTTSVRKNVKSGCKKNGRVEREEQEGSEQDSSLCYKGDSNGLELVRMLTGAVIKWSSVAHLVRLHERAPAFLFQMSRKMGRNQ